PARVAYWALEVVSRTMKKPLPAMARLLEMPVVLRAPWFQLLTMPVMATPVPTWTELEPLVVELPPPGARKVLLKASAKSTTPALNPVVSTLAMLLPITFICCWKSSRPETAEVRELSIIYSGVGINWSLQVWEESGKWRTTGSSYMPGHSL